jgi:hypothetical protein
MQEPHRKGLANHPDPESCVVSREAGCEALTGAHAGWTSSCEIIAFRVPTSSKHTEGITGGCENASIRGTLRSQRTQACMETPRARTGRPRHRPRSGSKWAGWRRP